MHHFHLLLLLLNFSYGGPHGHTQASYLYDDPGMSISGWDTFLASSHNVITVRVNGRGSEGRGDAFLYALHRRVGTYEVQDQIFASK